jgi:hypothetical protein
VTTPISSKQIAIFAVVGILLLTAIGCGGNSAEIKQQQVKADSLLNVAYRANQYERIEMLADSLRNAGTISDMRSSYWLGYANDKLMRKRLAEFFWTTGIAAFNPEEDQADIEVYAEMASRLAGLKCTLGAYEAALKVARTAVGQLQQMGCDTTSNYTNLVIYIGYCQSRFGLNRSTAAETLEEAYQHHLFHQPDQQRGSGGTYLLLQHDHVCLSVLCQYHAGRRHPRGSPRRPVASSGGLRAGQLFLPFGDDHHAHWFHLACLSWPQHPPCLYRQ